MKQQFTIPVTVQAYTKEEAQAQINLLIQMGAFVKDLNVSNLAGSFVEHFLISKLSQFSKGSIDMSRVYDPSGARLNVLTRKEEKKGKI